MTSALGPEAARVKPVAGRQEELPHDEAVPAELLRLTNAAIDASRALAAIDAEALDELRLTSAQYRVLDYLASSGPTNAVSLVSALDLSQSTISRTCDRLVKRRLLSRRISEVDRREVRLTPTRRGFEILEKLILLRRRKVGEVLGGLPPSLRQQVAEALEVFAGAHRERGGDGGPKAC